MSVNEKVLEKLRKILVLAGNKAATAGEVEAAMARAKEIAMQNNIDLAGIDLTDPNAKPGANIQMANDDGLQLGVAFWRKYHVWVCHVVQKVFGVRIITNRYKQGSRERCNKIWIIGEVTDVAVAKVMFSWLEELYPKSYRQAVNSFAIPEDNAAAQHGYYRGLTTGILEMNVKKEKEAEAQVGAQKWGLIVRNKETAVEAKVAECFPHLEHKQSKAVRVDHEAAAHGYMKGRQINLNQVSGGRNSSGQLN